MCATDCVLVGLDWAEPMMLFILHVTCSCIPMHTFFPFNIFWYILNCFGTFLIVFSLSLPLSVYVSLLLWHPNVNLLRPGTLFIPGHPLLLTILLSLSSSMMRRPNRTSLRTFLNEAFILNAKSSCRTSPTPTHPLLSIVGDGGHCVIPRSLVHPCWSRSFTPIYMDSILQYLISLPVFEVHALSSHYRLLQMCSVSLRLSFLTTLVVIVLWQCLKTSSFLLSVSTPSD